MEYLRVYDMMKQEGNPTNEMLRSTLEIVCHRNNILNIQLWKQSALLSPLLK